MLPVELDRVALVDLSRGAQTLHEVRRPTNRPVPRLLSAALVLTLAAGAVSALALRASAGRHREEDARLTVAVVDARGSVSRQPPSGGATDAAVTLTLRVSVPVRVIDAELDGAPPVSRPASDMALTRDPTVTVGWRVLCAEVGTIPGPRLLDVDLHAGTVDQHRRVRLATTDDDPVSRVFRLAAEQGCTPAKP